MRQIIIYIDADEQTCAKCEMQMTWKCANGKYVDCVLSGDTVAEGNAKPIRTAFCLAAEMKLEAAMGTKKEGA
jgi:hypothetical protein